MPERTEKIFRAARSGAQLLEVQLEQGGAFFDPDQVQLEVCMELDLMEAEEAQARQLEERIADLYHELDPGAVLQTLPGGDARAASTIRPSVPSPTSSQDASPTTPSNKERRTSPAYARPPASDAASSGYRTPRPVSKMLAEPAPAQLLANSAKVDDE